MTKFFHTTALFGALLLCPHTGHAILAGSEFGLPPDSPSKRIDPLTADSSFQAVGALHIDTGSSTFLGSAVVLSRHWVLSAGHNVDINQDGQPDPGLHFTLHLPGHGSMSTSTAYTHPDFKGFGNPSFHNDLSLLYFDDPLPELAFPDLGLSMTKGQEITLAGFGRSGFGSSGYTTQAGIEDRRIGWNTVSNLFTTSQNDGLVFRYTFHEPSHPQSLGNDRETIVGPGDSGGPALIPRGDGHALVGINTFVEGTGGRFGDVGGGVVLEPAWAWIAETTGLALIPEPNTLYFLLVGGLLLFWKRPGAENR